MNAKPGRAHVWLHKLVGEWVPETEKEWPESIRRVGDVWIVSESRGPLPDGTTGETVITLGYDTKRKQFVGTWIGSMMDMIWHYTGSLDASGRILTLDSEGPKMDGSGRVVRMRDIIELVGDDERIMRGEELQEDGTWKEFMRMRHRRSPA